MEKKILFVSNKKKRIKIYNLNDELNFEKNAKLFLFAINKKILSFLKTPSSQSSLQQYLLK